MLREGYGTGELEGRAEILLGRFSREASKETGGSPPRFPRVFKTCLVCGIRALWSRCFSETGDEAGSISLEASERDRNKRPKAPLSCRLTPDSMVEAVKASNQRIGRAVDVAQMRCPQMSSHKCLKPPSTESGCSTSLAQFTRVRFAPGTQAS